MKPYEKLSKVYAKDWGFFSLEYLKLVDYLKDSFGFIPKNILDISCGTGDLVNELFIRGFNVEGSDISEHMISIARAKNKNINFVIGDMAEFQFNHRFDLIISAFDSLNYLLSLDHLEKAFLNIRKHLNDNGYFIFDINTPSLCEEKHHGIIDREFEGEKFLQILNYDKENRIAKATFDFDVEGIEEHIQKAYYGDEIVQALHNSSLKVCKMFGDFNLGEVSERSYKIFFITNKE